MNMNWKYKIELKDKSVFGAIEKERGITIPAELKSLVEEANAATPEKYNFLIGSTEKVLGAILSFNYDESDTDTVYTALSVVKDRKLIPFAIDPFGNYICIDTSSSTVVFWDHETDKLSSISDTLNGFLEKLY